MVEFNVKNISKKIIGTIMLPLIMYIIVMIACYSNGKMYFGTTAMWKVLIVDIAISVASAMGIGLQFKNGRFDFSGGAIMLLSAIISGNIAKNMDNNVVIFFVLCILVSIVLSLIVGLVYVYGRLPIVIVTIGMALLYEAITCLIYNGSGINLVANTKLKIFSAYPMVLIPFITTVIVYWFYNQFTVSAKQGALLANNQQAAVNIGINEKKNIMISYLVSGIIFGLATTIYASAGLRSASFSSLGTVGELFTNILPVFIGLMLGAFCNDTIGIIMGSITLALMSFGFNAVISAEMGSAFSIIITGLFVLVINIASSKGAIWINKFKALISIKGKNINKTTTIG